MLQFFQKEMTDATLVRYSDGAYSDADGGDWVRGASTETPVRIIIPQPVKEDELVPLAEGEKVSNFRKTWSEVILKTRANDEDSDELVYEGKTYKVVQADDRSSLGNFYRSTIREVL